MLPQIARHSEKFYYFFEVANIGSLQATARKLRTSAASLSHSIRQLESAAGTELFIRRKTGVTPTDAGEKLLVYCRKYFREMEELQHLLERPDRITPQRIRVGTFHTLALHFWPLLLASFKPDSNISLSITTNRSKAILEALLRKEVDVALTVEAIEHKRLTKHELFKDDFSFYAPGFWQVSRLSRARLREHAILYIPDAIDEHGRSLRQYLHGWNLVFRDEFALDSLEIVGEFVKNGYGIGILPRRIAKTYGDSLKLIKVEGVSAQKFGTHRFYLSYRDDLDMPQSLMKLLIESAKKAVLALNT